MNTKKDPTKSSWYSNSILLCIIVAIAILLSSPGWFIFALVLLIIRFQEDSLIKNALLKKCDNLKLEKDESEEKNLFLEVTKLELEEKIESLEQTLSAEHDLSALNEFIENKSLEKNKLETEVTKLKDSIDHLLEQLNILSEIDTYKTLEKELSVLQVGILQKEYSFDISEEYKVELKNIQKQESDFIKDNKAVIITLPEFLQNDSKRISDKVLNTASKLLLRAFNNECDAVCSKITHKNIENSRKRIDSSFTQLNKLGDYFGVSISSEYLKLKILEAQVMFEYEVKKQEELEEQKAIKEQMREEAKVQAEILKLEKEAQKEEDLYSKALEKAKADLKAATESEQIALLTKIKSLEDNLKAAEEKMQRAKSMAEQTKSGFVYIISNIGSFGDNVYKIGMTRRLDPQERINELSNASVPFPFDVHATIYTHDAPALENKLHQAFDTHRINKVNSRKEFFNVSIDEIVEKVHELHGDIKLTKQAEAYQYRQSLAEAM